MKKAFLFFLLIYICLLGFVFAQEPPSYNFGSAQGAKELIVVPGNEVEAIIYFYNVFGNRITHISLSVGEAPQNWEIAIQPALHTETYDVAGVLTEVQENLSVEPDEIVEEIPKETAGFTYIPAPNVGGFIPAKEVKVKIRVPADEQLGKEFIVIIDGTAEWLGQAGTVAFKQGRSFEYKITTIAEEFYEKRIEVEKKAEKSAEELPTPFTVLVSFISSNVLGVILALIIIVMVLFVLLKRKRKEFYSS